MSEQVKLKGEAKQAADLIEHKQSAKLQRRANAVFHGKLPRRGWGYRFVGVPA